jgi:hypothetical protein
MSNLVVFSAAPPGQKGSHHVNLRPQSDWITAFQKQHFLLSDLTKELKCAIADANSEAKYIATNLMAFTSQTWGVTARPPTKGERGASARLLSSAETLDPLGN